MNQVLRKILIIGSGGREHALGVRMLQDSNVSEVFVYPGNPGMKLTENLLPILPLMNEAVTFEKALQISKEKNISLVVIGPEWALFQAWVDRFTKEGIPAFGPSKAASILEESKIKAKLFMQENQIPTADFKVAKNLEETLAIINAHPKWDGYVLKLSGPALGKGVVVTHSVKDAMTAARDFFHHQPPGIEDGLVVEELIEGREVSLFYVCMGDQYQFLTSACDHKRLLDQDEGPNTGGMGAYSPASWVSAEILKTAEEQFVHPTLQGMKKLGTPFSGVLFLGLMIREEVPYLLEYNTRFGDPETQTILPRLEGNFTDLLMAVAKNNAEEFKRVEIKESPRHSLHIVKAAKGYPGLFGAEIETGKLITAENRSLPNEQIYFAGVREENDKLFSNGGRVLGLTVIADSIPDVQRRAYQRIHQISFEGEQFRTDIGAKR